MLDRFRFSSDGLPEADAFAAYVDLYRQGSDVHRGSHPFAADVRAWRFSDMLAFERRVSGAVHERTGRVASDEFDHFVATLVLSGQVTGSPASGFASARPGDIFLVDTRRPSWTEFIDAHVITVSIARDLIEAGVGSTLRLHGRVLSPPTSLVLADFFRSLVRNGDALEQSTLPGLSRALIELLSATEGLGGGSSAESRRQDYRRRAAVERVIKAQLADRKLSVVTISADTGVSRSALYRLFEADGGIARLIVRRRLEGVRQLLDDRTDGDFPTIASDCGFADERQMKRLFSEAFGVSPSIYRAEVAMTAPDDLSDARRRWQGWMTEVS